MRPSGAEDGLRQFLLVAGLVTADLAGCAQPRLCLRVIDVVALTRWSVMVAAIALMGMKVIAMQPSAAQQFR